MSFKETEIKKSIVNGYALSNLEDKGWKRCFFEQYSHKTKVADIISNCPIDDNVYLFVGALPSPSSKLAYVGAFCPSSLLITHTNSRTRASKPKEFQSDNQYKVYQYNFPGKSFGFAPESNVTLYDVDNKDKQNKQRLSWHLTGRGGWRAGSTTGLYDDTRWHKVVYYKKFDDDMKEKEGSGTTPLNERINKIEDSLSELQESVKQIAKQMNDLQSKFSEESKNQDTMDIEKEIQSLKEEIKMLKEKNNINVQEVKNWVTNTVELPQYIDLFIENGLDDINIIKHIGMNELKQIGIDKIGHSIKIMTEIEKLNRE